MASVMDDYTCTCLELLKYITVRIFHEQNNFKDLDSFSNPNN